MDTIYNAFGLGLLLLAVNHIISSSSQCLTGCTCATAHHGRSLLCMETALFKIPEDIPGDFTKIRIEKSHLTEIPKSAFCRHKSLQHLWLNFNNITIINIQSLEGLANLTELRLEGNKLRSIPWTAFEDTPSLRILDLKHNWLDVLPEHALKYLPYLTYLDLSFNQLTVASRDVFLKWPLYDTVFRARARETVHANVVLALHENPWLCDCRLRGFVEFVRNLSPPFILMNSYLSCSGPENMAGKFFHEIELKTCTKPVATSPSTNISSALRANVTLPCFAMGRPPPAVWWTYGLKILRGFQEFQTHVNEDTIKSELVIPSLQLSDQGVYTCTANNFIGNASVSILVDIKSPDDSKSPAFSPAPEENVYIDIHIAKQTVYGISIEWYAVTEKPSETWFTIHFGHYDNPTKELIHVGPGINTYSVTDLLPATKYDICVTLKNQAPRSGQCIVFVTGSDMSEMEQREQLIHIVVIVFAMVLAVPAGMYACTTDAKFHCFKRGLEMCRNWRRSEQTYITNEGQVTFDSFQVASDEVLCKDSSEGHKTHRRSDDRVQKNKLEQKPTTQLY